HTGRRRVGRGAVLLQQLRPGETRKLELAALRVGGVLALAHRDRAVDTDRDVAVARLKDDRAVLPDDLQPFRGDELALAVDLERAVARVAFAARGLHGEKRIAADRHVER